LLNEIHKDVGETKAIANANARKLDRLLEIATKDTSKKLYIEQ